MTYFRREPAVIIALVAGLVQVLSAFMFHFTDEQQGALNAALGLLGGMVVAGMVSLDKAVPLVAGFAQAVFSVGLAFGWEINPVAQSAVMALISSIAGAFIRTQVTVGVAAVEEESHN